MAKLTITVTDPATIELLAKYRQFIKDEDGARGTIAQAAEGLIIGSLDTHERFANWRRRRAGVAPAAPNNVTVLPTALWTDAETTGDATPAPVRRTA